MEHLPADRQTDRQIAARHIDAVERVRLAQAPVDLDGGAFDAASAGANLKLVLLVALVSPLGGLLAYVCLPAPGEPVTGWRLILYAFGTLVAGLALVTAVLGLWIETSRWRRREQRVDDWHHARLDAFVAAQGEETERALSIWEYSESNPAHVLLAAICVQQRIAAGESVPWSTRQLEGDVWLRGSGSQRMVKVGYISPGTAERIGGLFGDMGLVAGRKARSAGKWQPGDMGELVGAFVDKWEAR
jgi:hypothetical protein